MHELKKVSGRWRGTYEYDPSDKIPKMVAVRFTLILKQGWFGHFTGSVTEDAPEGTPGTGTIDGYFLFPRIEFKKQMPIAYVIEPDGRRVTLRESLIAKGYALEQDIPAPEIQRSSIRENLASRIEQRALGS